MYMQKHTAYVFFLIILLSFLNFVNTSSPQSHHSSQEELINWALSNGVKFNNVELRSDNKFYLTNDVYQGDSIFSIPLNLTLHPLEDFIYKEYFNISEKNTLIGRLLIEKTLGEDSAFYPWISKMKQASEMNDFYHLSEAEVKELNRRSLEEIGLGDRRQGFVKLRRNIPSEILDEKTFNYEIFNWANSIIDGHGFVYMIDEVSGNKLSHVRIYNPSKYQAHNLILIPLLDLVQVISTENRVQNNWFGPTESVYSQNFIHQNKDRLEITAPKSFSKGQEFVFIDFRSNRDFLLYHGTMMKDLKSEDLLLKLRSNFDLEKMKLCWDIGLTNRNSLTFSFFLNNMTLSNHLLYYSRIGLFPRKEDYTKEKYEIIRLLQDEEDITTEINVLLSYRNILNDIMSMAQSSGKTTIEDDIKSLDSPKFKSQKLQNILRFAISNKKILNRHMVMINRKLLKEYKKFFNSFFRQHF